MALETPDAIRPLMNTLALSVEVLGVGVIVIGLAVAGARYLRGLLTHAGALAGKDATSSPYERFRTDLGRAILLGLEILVAADIIATVTTHPSVQNLTILGLLVLIRTFLSFSLEIELTGRLPWKGEARDGKS